MPSRQMNASVLPVKHLSSFGSGICLGSTGFFKALKIKQLGSLLATDMPPKTVRVTFRLVFEG
jgi:hypothetical protein